MSRTVSYPSGCTAVCFVDVSGFGYNELGDYDEATGEWDWDDFVEDIKTESLYSWPSLVPSQEWLGWGRKREDRVLIENNHAYIGVSEYCGLAAVWLKPKDDSVDGTWADTSGIAQHWCEQISPKFNKLFGQLRKVGTFSNGEAVYEQI